MITALLLFAAAPVTTADELLEEPGMNGGDGAAPSGGDGGTGGSVWIVTPFLGGSDLFFEFLFLLFCSKLAEEFGGFVTDVIFLPAFVSLLGPKYTYLSILIDFLQSGGQVAAYRLIVLFVAAPALVRGLTRVRRRKSAEAEKTEVAA